MRLLQKAISVILLLVSMGMYAQEKELTVAERNAAQGFNDTIDRLAPDFVTVSLMIADPTDQRQDYLGMTGHAFLRLQCPTFALDYCCSYETERIKGQLWDYLTGKLRMGMFAVPTDEYLEDYRIWQRAVHEYRINLPADAKLRLWEQMDNHAIAEQDMQIDLMKFGCANSLLRYVERAIAPTRITYDWPERFTAKSAIEIAEEHMENYPWSFLGMRILEGSRMRKLHTPKQKVIFPLDLLEVWQNATINNQPMLTYVADIVDADPIEVRKPRFTPQLCGILLMLLMTGMTAILIYRKRKA